MQKLPCVLLVDDDETTNFLNEELLRSLGVTDRVLVATNGREALALLATLRQPTSAPLLVLLDIHMPVMNGIDFLKAYAPGPLAPPIVVVLTTSLHPADLDRVHQVPHADLVTKPLTAGKVDAILQKHFQRRLPTT